MPTAVSFVTGNRTMYLFYLLKENFKNLLFDSLIMGWEKASRIYLIYQVVRRHKGDSEEYARTYYEALNH